MPVRFVSRGRSTTAAALCTLALTALPALAQQPGEQVEIKMASGETIKAALIERSGGTVRVNHPVLGEISLPADKVTVAAIPPPPKPPETFFDGWKKSVELGLAGSAGNSETLSVRAFGQTQRKTDTMETTLSLTYIYATDDGAKSKSRGELFGRNDWNFGKDSPWGFFVLGRVEYDEFQSWLWRFSAFAGPSYTFIKNDTITLRGRIGAGARTEAGRDADNRVKPEGLAGLDFNWNIKDGQSFFATGEYLPDLDRVPQYRLVGSAGYKITLDKASGLNVSAGVTDRYSSNPGQGRKRNDVEYFINLGVSF